MNASKEDLIDLMFDNRRQYVIPVYQRNYDWNRDDVQEMFDDIMSAYKLERTHFFGTMVQVLVPDEDNTIRRYVIIGGQQRFTSVYLLLKALYDAASNADDKDELAAYMFNKSSKKSSKRRDNVNKKDAYRVFKEWAEGIDGGHETILSDMKKYAMYYKAFIRGDDAYSSNVNALLVAFRSLGQTTIYPLLFSIFDDFANKTIDDDTLSSVLLFFVNYTVRRLVVGVPSNSLRKFYCTLYRRIFGAKDTANEGYAEAIYGFMATLATTKDGVPRDTPFKDALTGLDVYKNRALCRYLLAAIENGVPAGNEAVAINESTTIEHIMPQNKNDVWQKEMGTDYDLIYDKYIHTLGNLTLTGYNSELSDKSFAEKKALIIAKSKFATLNKDVISLDVWSEEAITKRAERLSGILMERFCLPDRLAKATPQIKTERHSLTDEADLSSTKPISFTLFGKTHEVSSYRQMLLGALSCIHESNSEGLRALSEHDYKAPQCRRVYLSCNSALLHSPKEIENIGIYAETNLSANNVTYFIKSVMRELNLLTDDYSFLIQTNFADDKDDNTESDNLFDE